MKESGNEEPEVAEKESYDEELRKILSNPTVASKEWVIRQYDHEVQGCSIMKPLLGADNDGPCDASIVSRFLNQKRLLIRLLKLLWSATIKEGFLRFIR